MGKTAPTLNPTHPCSDYCTPVSSLFSSQVYTDDLLWFSVYSRAKWNRLLCTYTDLFSTVQPVHTVQTSAPNNARHRTYRVEIRVPIDITDNTQAIQNVCYTYLRSTVHFSYFVFVSQVVKKQFFLQKPEIQNSIKKKPFFVPFIFAAFYATRILSGFVFSVTMRIRIRTNNADLTRTGSGSTILDLPILHSSGILNSERFTNTYPFYFHVRSVEFRKWHSTA